MAQEHLNHIVQHLRRLAGPGPAERRADAELLERFVTLRDAEAFEALVQQHGHLVWAVCRRLLERDHDAEDVFQAVFLVLARKAASIRKRQSIASWLYGVAYRLSRKYQAEERRRKAHEKQAVLTPQADAAREAVVRETARIIAEEVQGLPEKYRAAVVLCYLGGRTREEAAQELRWPIGTLKTRLRRALALLEKRLARRGLGLSLAAVLLGESAAEAIVPPALLATSTSAALASLSGSATLPASATAVRLAREATRGIFLSRVRGLILLLAVGILLAGGGALALRDRPLAEEQRAQVLPPPDRPRELPQPAREPALEVAGLLLPENAAARLGSTTFLHDGTPLEFAFSGDGKHLFSVRRDIRLWDVATGAEIRRFTVRAADGSIPVLGGVQGLAVSPDSRYVAARSPWDMRVHVWEVSSGREVVRFAPELTNLSRAQFSPDGRLLAHWYFDGDPILRIYQSREPPVDVDNQPIGRGLCVWDPASGQVSHLAHFDAAGGTLFCAAEESLAAWSRVLNRESGGAAVDGKLLVRLVQQHTAGYEVPPVAEVVRRAAAEPQSARERVGRAQTLLGMNYHGPCSVSRDGKTLAAAARAGDGSVILLDLVQGKELYRLPRAGALAMAFSPDGGLLATAGLDCRLHLWDVASGRELHKPQGESGAAFLAFSRDGTRLLASGKDGGCIWDVAGRVQLATFSPRRPKTLVRGVAHDGRLLVATHEMQDMRLEDPLGAQPTRRIGASGQVVQLPFFLNDRRTILYGSAASINICDSATGECRGPFKIDLRARMLNFADDIAVVAALPGDTLMVHLHRWDSQRRVLMLLDTRTREVLAERDFEPEEAERYYSPVYSPDSSTCAGLFPRAVRLWETCTGKLLLDIPCALGTVKRIVFSPDGRLLVFAEGPFVHVWDTATAQKIVSLGPVQRAAIAFAFSPDGQKLATGYHNGELLVWDLPPRGNAATGHGPYGASELEQLWSALALSNSAAYRAAWSLVDAPEQAVALLNQRLKPASEEDAAQIRRLITELQSENDALRAAAFSGLRQLGGAAVPELRRAVAGSSPEARQRLEAILKELALSIHFPPAGDRLRRLRAVAVLERIGTPHARALLHSLATGSATSEQTLYARAALTRLQARDE